MPIVQTNGIDMYYAEAGDGPPLLMIMGITAPGSVWEAHADAWKAHFRCIMPDNRGVGRSSKPGGSYTSARMADDMAGLLDALELERVRVVGCVDGEHHCTAVSYPLPRPGAFPRAYVPLGAMRPVRCQHFPAHDDHQGAPSA